MSTNTKSQKFVLSFTEGHLEELALLLNVDEINSFQALKSAIQDELSIKRVEPLPPPITMPDPVASTVSSLNDNGTATVVATLDKQLTQRLKMKSGGHPLIPFIQKKIEQSLWLV